MTRVSVVVATWRDREECLGCLASLVEAGWAAGDLEVIVVDNGSEDRAGDAVAARFPAARVLRNEANRGVAAARNQGIREARGDSVLLLDADTRVRPGAVGLMLDSLAGRSVGVVGPRLVSQTGELQFTGRRFPTLAGKLGRRLDVGPLRDRAHGEELRDWDHATERDVGYVIGACQLIRREVFDRVGLLDERIFYGPEDVDFCLRAQLDGWRVVYEPRAVVEHRERRITKTWRPNLLTLKHATALAYYFAKHRYLFSTRRLDARIESAQKAAEHV